MCCQVWIKDEVSVPSNEVFNVCHTVDELRKHCPNIIFNDNYDESKIDSSDCLCCVDIEATADLNDFKFTHELGDIFYDFYK
jgi:hypothetical protein